MGSFRDRLLAARAIQTNVVIQREFITRERCAELIRKASHHDFEPAGIIGRGVLPDIRNVMRNQFTWDEAILEEIGEASKSSFNVTMLESETASLLRYPEGGHYVAHFDSGHISNGEAVRAMDRDISIVLYLNDDFEGGEFEFVHSNEMIKPEAGMLIAFPSDWRHTHRVHPVTRGERWAIVNWYSSTPRLIPDRERV
jgi:predicted 2-oxoglutarate/Fe(II)-dependent dioxygenase YbiX